MRVLTLSAFIMLTEVGSIRLALGGCTQCGTAPYNGPGECSGDWSCGDIPACVPAAFLNLSCHKDPLKFVSVRCVNQNPLFNGCSLFVDAFFNDCYTTNIGPIGPCDQG